MIMCAADFGQDLMNFGVAGVVLLEPELCHSGSTYPETVLS